MHACVHVLKGKKGREGTGGREDGEDRKQHCAAHAFQKKNERKWT